ncbi:hypothetical protein KXD93_00495 [Mucilaginibacter sp. BJC16-A38]|uniref:hypothetical protein n=1 Tax=Mucilaginibacter phenanthrenivorans TaxID=1234842 RepID=UPI002157B3D5|nr:hypothetical protein [Mucilaginibacter phenanthrenivorans]MCR8556096.1 hypothetical protein [Mucilaginibacter phenanthrenivorans]
MVFPKKALCQNDFEKALAKKVDSLLAPEKTGNNGMENQLMPNDAQQSATIPMGFGGFGTYAFGSIAGVYKQVYHNNADLIASGGFCAGDPIKAVNFAAGINMTDVHRFRDFSANFMVSRFVANGTSVSAGGLQLFASKKQSDAPGSTFFVAVSHAVQTMPSATPGASRLTYTIGIGNGRFYNKSYDDIAAGRGQHGTAVFGGISYEWIEHVNLIGEWSGMNLGLSMGIRPFKNPLSLAVGAINLLRYSGDKPSLLFSIGYPLALSRQAD